MLSPPLVRFRPSVQTNDKTIVVLRYPKAGDTRALLSVRDGRTRDSKMVESNFVRWTALFQIHWTCRFEHDAHTPDTRAGWS